MPIADKYRLHRQVGWSDAAEVHAGPHDPSHGVAVAVKIRHGNGGPVRPGGNRDRFLRAINDQAAAALAGCKGIAPVYETGQEGNDAFYVTKLYPRSLDSLIQGRVSLDAAGLGRLTDNVLKALEELRDKHGRTHGNVKPTNIFLDGKTVQTAQIVLGDLALREEASNQAADCYALGATLYQLLRGRTVRNFDWPMEHGPDWEKLGPLANAWRRFCNVLMAPDLGMLERPLAEVRQAFKKMKARADDAPSLKGTGAASSERGGEVSRPETGSNKGVLAGAGAAIVAVVGGGFFYFNQTNQRLSDRLRSATGTVNAVNSLTPAIGGLIKGMPSLPGGLLPGSTPNGQSSPAGDRAGAGESPTPSPDAAAAAATPLVAETTPPPAPTPVTFEVNKWDGYRARLSQLQERLGDSTALEQPDLLNGTLTDFKDYVQYQSISSEAEVGSFLRRFPAKLEGTGDLPDLPPNLWTKLAVEKQEEMRTATYSWGRSDLKVQFNRIAPLGGNGPAFYLSATTVPVRFGVLLAQMPPDGGRPLPRAGGPVAWEFATSYQLRRVWLPADLINPFYANTGGPTVDSPMNGLSGAGALRLARAAGCLLPTLDQWKATLNSPAGQAWTAPGWQKFAKVRNQEWSTFAKGIATKSLAVSGMILPNDQCFGDNKDHADLSPVGDSSDHNLFFAPVNSGQPLKGFTHLIGNVGQYVVDDARNPRVYYFAGGSAESSPATFQDFARPPAAPAASSVAADAGFRLAIPAKGSGGDKNPALDRLKNDLNAEIKRAAALK